jgi:type I restriction enzyme M protein
MNNIFCKKIHLTNEASVETWFVDKLLSHLSYSPEDIKLKTSLKEFKIGSGSKSSLYKPDYVVSIENFPALVIDAKSPQEHIENWTSQCSSYCLELNKEYKHNPVEYFLITNGLETSLYKWDVRKPLINLNFEDFIEDGEKFSSLINYIGKNNLRALSEEKHETLMDSKFEFNPLTVDEISKLFIKIHDDIWKNEIRNPSAAFEELMKIIFIKIKKDEDLYEKFDGTPLPKNKDVVFSTIWIKNQTETDNPINDILFKNLIKDLEKKIREKKKKRIFNIDDNINLNPNTIEKIVEYIEHVDFYKLDEDVHGRIFEILLDSTIRGKALGQYFTPRDIVKLMVGLADIEVNKDKIETVLDACCGSGGFLIYAMNDMLLKSTNLKGLTNIESNEIKKKIVDKSLTGIDGGSEPPIYRIARMNMYLHGDGGSNIFFADSLNKKIGQVGRSTLELDEEIFELKDLLISKKKKFDVILSNPPFSMTYSRDNPEQRQILDQYIISENSKTLLSSLMFLERYKDLVSENGRIFAIIDESVLSGDRYEKIRNFIREMFIIIGVVSLPGDAFKRASARVKTSILILRLKKDGEEQKDIFMQKSIYLGLSNKTAKRIGIDIKNLEKWKGEETQKIIEEYKKFRKGKNSNFIVSNSDISNRLDVKFCLRDNGRLQNHWVSQGFNVTPIDNVLKNAKNRQRAVVDDEVYTLLKVTYDGNVLEADIKEGSDISYQNLYKVHTWDILLSNMGVGRGAISIVPEYYHGKYVSNEYNILIANSKEEAVFYTNILRTKEILGDILTSSTGMNRGRIKWDEISKVTVPIYDKTIYDMEDTVNAIENLWDAHNQYNNQKLQQMNNIVTDLKLEDESAKQRWLAYKPPE